MIKAAILQLYKQHHIKHYENLSKGQYSCWGNYDSMSIEKVVPQKGTLIKSRDTLGLTDTWYHLSDMLGSQDGTYSQQCISLIYEETQEGTLDSFLEPDEYFCCACLLKLQDPYQTNLYGRLLAGESEDDAGYVNSISFRTMDNADAVVLLKGNSYNKIMNQVIAISRDIPQILYTYSICGINQAFLNDDKWDGAKHALVDDKIQYITNRIMTKPAVDIERLEKTFAGEGEWTWSLGNTDIIWNLKTQGQTICRAIDLMRPYSDEKNLPGYAATNHLHPLYGNEIYGITTEVIPQFNDYKATAKTAAPSFSATDRSPQPLWCRTRIKELRNRLGKSRKQKNDTLYSYYLALIQSLTMIVPYEESLFAKDIFYIVFPSLLMFHKQLDAALNEKGQEGLAAYNIEKNENWNILIKNLANYLDMLDQIVYRSIHSEQTFFMAPGYCGALYTILPKLSMMYMALLYSGIDVLQESSEKYECCLYPVIGSKPCTTEVDFNLQPAERLIEIKISQRSMFSANLMPILLLHELSHYVGIGRNRSFRALCMIKAWGAVLAERLLSCNIELDSFQQEYMDILYDSNIEEVRSYIIAELTVRMDSERTSMNELYFNDTFLMLVDFSEEILTDKDNMLETMIRRRNHKLKEGVGKIQDQGEFTNRIRQLENLYSALKNNIPEMLKSEHIERMKSDMKLCFKETYADIIALYLIGFENNPELYERYFEVYALSEGINFRVGDISTEQINRVAVVTTILSKLDPHAESSWNTLIEDKIQKYKKCKTKMNSIDYLPLFAHIYRTIMENEDTDIEDRTLVEIAQMKEMESEVSTAELAMTWVSQMEYFDSVVGELEKKKSDPMTTSNQLRTEARERIRRLYALLNTTDYYSANGLKAFDDMIHWYKDQMDQKRKLDLDTK